MLEPTWLELAILLGLTAVSICLFLHRLIPVLRIVPVRSRMQASCRTQRVNVCVISSGKSFCKRRSSGRARSQALRTPSFLGIPRFLLGSVNHFANGFGRALFHEESLLLAILFALAALFAFVVILSMVDCIRRFIVQPKWLGKLSLESGIITILILILMVTYPLRL